jgi:TatD DNase family protein
MNESDSSNQDILRLPGAVDSHCHILEMIRKGLDPDLYIGPLKNAGFAAVLDVGLDPHDWEERKKLAERFPILRLSAGLHPSRTADPNLSELLGRLRHVLSGCYPTRQPLFSTETRQPPRFANGPNAEGTYPDSPPGKHGIPDSILCSRLLCAIGETGIDLYRLYAPVKVQQDAFVFQLDLAREFNLPVIIHNRDADQPLIECLDSVPRGVTGVVHCFSSDTKAAEAFLERGLYISFAGNLTYKNASALRSVAGTIPLDRILAETDSPYLSPHPYRGKPNHPGRVGHTITVLAEIHNVSPEDMAGITRDNFFRLFGAKSG